MKLNTTVLAHAVAVAVSLLSTVARAQHAGDVFVGRSAAGQLKIGPPGAGGYIPDQSIKVLPPVSGLFDGWSDNNPGFDHIITDQPAFDFYVLQSGCQVKLELVATDPAFKLITASFAVIDTPGQQATMGGSTLHVHFTWLIDSDDPSFDPLKTLWRVTYRMVDLGSTGYAPSAPFTFHFANVACTRGDCNGDGVIDGRDIDRFVQIILNPVAATSVDRCDADLNLDGYATIDDVSSFVDKLLSP